MRRIQGTAIVHYFITISSTQIIKIILQVIIWDDGLSGPFGLIAEYSLLKKRDVLKMYPLRPGKLKIVEMENVIFITRPQLKLMGYIADTIHGYELITYLLPPECITNLVSFVGKKLLVKRKNGIYFTYPRRVYSARSF